MTFLIITIFIFFHADMATDMETKDFLEEIALMKSIGFHKNIINLIGCSTILKSFFLVLDYMSNGDLLHYLRKKRKNVSSHVFVITIFVVELNDSTSKVFIVML